MTTWQNLPEADRQRLRDRVRDVTARAQAIAEAIRNRPWIKAVMVHNVTVQCRMCEQVKTFRCERDALEAWILGELIQRALPSLTLSQREMLMTGTCTKCWNELFPEEYPDAD